MRTLVFFLFFGPGPADTDIAELNSNHFATRQAASVRLREMGKCAIPRLEKEMSKGNLEFKTRCEALVEPYYSLPSSIPPICALPEEMNGLMECYLRKAHRVAKGDVQDYNYTHFNLPVQATRMMFKDMLYWGFSRQDIEALHSKMAARAYQSTNGYHPVFEENGLANWAHICDKVLYILDPNAPPEVLPLPNAPLMAGGGCLPPNLFPCLR
jgi:hypothetical protein